MGKVEMICTETAMVMVRMIPDKGDDVVELTVEPGTALKIAGDLIEVADCAITMRERRN